MLLFGNQLSIGRQMRRFLWLIRQVRPRLVVILVAVSSLPARGQNPQITVLHCGRLIDTKNAIATTGIDVVIERGRIIAVGPGLPVPFGAREIDLTQMTVLPGLIDAHTHLLTEYEPSLPDALNGVVELGIRSDALRALRGAVLAREMLYAGFTAVRDLGNAGEGADLALRDAINAGWSVGPRMYAASRAISATDGQASQAPQRVGMGFVTAEYRIVTGPVEARRAVREAIFEGADLIKVIVNPGPSLARDELDAIVDEARRHGKRVAAHATDDASVRLAVEAGVSSVEHAYDVSDAALTLMRARGAWLVPTDFPVDHFLAFYDDSATKANQRARIAATVRAHQMRLSRALQLNVGIAFGSDSYYAVPGQTRGQTSLSVMRAYSDAGMEPLRIIQAATINAARLLGVENTMGSIEVGKTANIIAIDGNPIADIRALESVRFVMKEGEVVVFRVAK